MRKNCLFVVCLCLVATFGALAQGSGSTIPLNSDNKVLFTGSAGSLLTVAGTDPSGTGWGTNATLNANYATIVSTGCAWGASMAPFTVAAAAKTSVAGYEMVSMDVYSTVSTQYAMTLQMGGADQYMGNVTAPANTWTRIKRAVPKDVAQSLDGIIIVVGDCSSRPTVYVDNIHLYNNPPEPVPTVKASDPPLRGAGTYLSLYNDQPYNTPSPACFGLNGQAVNFPIGTESVRKVTLVPQDWGAIASFGFAQPYPDVNEFKYLHVDLWSGEAVSAGVFRLLVLGAGDAEVETSVYIPALKAGEWTSFTFKLSQLTLGWNAGGRTLESILSSVKDVRIASNGLNFESKTLFVDNIYFYMPEDPETTPPSPMGDRLVSLYPSSVANPYGGYTIGKTIDELTGLDNPYMKVTSLSANNTGIAHTSTVDITEQSLMQMYVWVKPKQSPALTVTLYDRSGASFAYPVAGLQSGLWNTVKIPVNRMTGIDLSAFKRVAFSGTGVVYVDDVCMYTINGNVEPVAEVGGVRYLSIKEAYDTHKNDGGTVEIAVIADSKEPEPIYIAQGDGNFDRLVIYPKGGARTVTYTGMISTNANNLFTIDGNTGRTIVLDGRVDKAGSASGLVLAQANELPVALRSHDNALVSVQGNGVTVQYCTFKGLDSTKRPEAGISPIGSDIRIVNNRFEDCLFLGETFDGSNHYGIAVVNVYQSTADYPAYEGIEIRDNHFYETTAVDFTFPIIRSFINFSPLQQTGYVRPAQIVGNKIGGAGRTLSGDFDGGVMQYGYAGTAGATASLLSGIVVLLNWAAPDMDGSDTSKYTVIENNEVAWIALRQPTTSFHVAAGVQQAGLGTFTAIMSNDGLVRVKGNRVHDIENKVKAPTENIGFDRYLLHGIRHEVNGGDCRFFVEDNRVYNLTGAYLNDASQNAGYLQGIFVQAVNNSGYASKVRGQVRDNRVMLGVDFREYAMGMSSSFSSIQCNIQDIAGGNSVQIDLYNNIASMTGFKFRGAESPWDVEVVKIANTGSTSGTGTLNCYNNIVYIQPAEAESFSSARTAINGLYVQTGSAGQRTRVFHNTVLIKDLNLGDTGIRTSPLMISGQGRLEFVNNILTNLNSDGFVLYAHESQDLYGDYNTYYAHRDWGAFGTGSYNYGFDAWKLGFNKAREMEMHSRCQYPLFGNKAEGAIPDMALTMEGLEGLKNSLRPYNFVGGRKLATGADSELGSLLEVRTDASNTDIAGVVRRPYMPTAGAVNTGFTNYWTGASGTAWNVPGNWADGVLPADDADIVFAPDPADVQGIASVGRQVSNHLLLTTAETKIHDLYNDTRRQLNVDGRLLVITGYVAEESYARNAYAKIDARTAQSKVVYNGNPPRNPPRNPVADPEELPMSSPIGSSGQHIFEGTFVGNQVYDLELANQSNYFILLHADEAVQPTLEILNNLTNMNADRRSEVGRHLGGLNAVWFPATLQFSAVAGEHELPRYALFNDSVYNLVVGTSKLRSQHDSLYVANNLTIAAGRNLEIPADKYVKVGGTTVNANGVDGLLIKADPQHARPSGTFIFNTADAVQASVEFYVKAATPEGTEPKASLFTWQYFGSPVETAPADDFHGAYIREFNESKEKAPWTSLANGSVLTPFTGYEISRYEQHNNFFTMKGKLVNRHMDKALSATANMPYAGQYVLSNPYTASLPINTAMFGATGSGLEQTVYLFNAGTMADWEAHEGAQTGKAPGQYVAVPSALADEMGITSIPSMQGFVIRSNGNVNNVFKFRYADNVVKNPVAPRSAVRAEEGAPLAYTRVSLLSGEQLKDQLWLFTREGATKGFDNGYDGYKLVLTSKLPQLFAEGEDGAYQVHTVPDVDGTYLYFKAEEGVADYTLRFDHALIDEHYESLYLLDLETGTEVDITAEQSSYTFQSLNSGSAGHRFLIRSTQSEGGATLHPLIYLYQSNAMMHIRNGYAKGGALSLYDLAGGLIFRQTIQAQGLLSLSEERWNAGVYILHVDIEGESPFAEKVIIN